MTHVFQPGAQPQWNWGTPSATYVRQFLLSYWHFYCLERVCPPHKCGVTYANSSVCAQCAEYGAFAHRRFSIEKCLNSTCLCAMHRVLGFYCFLFFPIVVSRRTSAVHPHWNWRMLRHITHLCGGQTHSKQ